MWVEFITKKTKEKINDVTTIVTKRAFVDITKVLSVSEETTDMWNAELDESEEINCLEIHVNNKIVTVIDISYEEMIQMLQNIPKNSPYYRSKVC